MSDFIEIGDVASKHVATHTETDAPHGPILIGDKLAPYNPTNIECVHMALDMMKIKEDDMLFDLGWYHRHNININYHNTIVCQFFKAVVMGVCSWR
jgi:hypothetical protein